MDKTVKRLVVIERGDDVIAIAPSVLGEDVVRRANLVGVSNKVQPVPCPPLAKCARCQQAIYDLLVADYGLRAGEAEERIEVVSATAADSRTLEVRPGAPLVSIVRTAWAVDGRGFEYSRDLFRADRVRIVARVRGRDASSLGSAVEVVNLA